MEKTYVYRAKGLVYGKYWGGGAGAYRAESLSNADRNLLIAEIDERVKNGSLDAGMGYETLLGAIMEIETEESIVIAGKTYSKTESEIQFFGNLTEQVQNFLQECLWR